MDSSLSISAIERQTQILQWISRRQRITVAEICRQFSVSEATARRDLDKLHEFGQIKRIHGGAIVVERTLSEVPVIQRINQNAEEKRRIGKLAATLIKEGDTVFIGSGSTTQEVARNLIGRQNITVITNAMTVINLLSQEESISLVAIGGFLRSSELSFIGHLTEQALHELRSQKVFMGIHAISLVEGLMSDYLPEVSTDRVIIQSAPEVVLVADHTKFGKVSTALVAPLSAIHTLVTDTGISETALGSLRKMVKNVLLA